MLIRGSRVDVWGVYVIRGWRSGKLLLVYIDGYFYSLRIGLEG